MATPKEQRDARPGARNVGVGDSRTPPADALRPVPAEAQDRDPSHDLRRAEPPPRDVPSPS